MCDYPVFRQNKKATCDTLMCDQCRNGDKELDFCRTHFNKWRNDGRKFAFGGTVHGGNVPA